MPLPLRQLEFCDGRTHHRDINLFGADNVKNKSKNDIKKI